jgi:NADPH:quinone reductase-like Zn-dependent oxidoreductase
MPPLPQLSNRRLPKNKDCANGNAHMKAIVYSNYGPPDVLKCEEIEKPTAGDNEVLIRVRAASVNPADWHFMRGTPYFVRIPVGLRKPKVTRLGIDVAGQVEAVGRSVTQFKPGDEVFGSCRGAFAEYVCTAESALVMKPNNVTFEQAASVPVAALTALQGLREKGQIQPGQQVLINGAAGGVGTFAVQIAKSFGAAVTGVCSTRNVEMVRSIGADRVIDYTQEDFTKGTRRYDLILDCVGNHSFSARRNILNPNGICVMVGAPNDGNWIGPLAGVLKVLALSRFVSQSFVAFIGKASKRDLTIMGELMEAGKVTPVIDRRYGLSDVPDAIRYLEDGHARGKVVITLDRNNKAKETPEPCQP